MTKKYFLITLLILIISHSSVAQSNTRTFATFKECENAIEGSACYTEKIKADLNNLISEDVTDSLKQTIEENYFPISFAFLSDAEGKVIPETLKIACENKLLYEKIKQYVDRLAPFLPKDKSIEEGKNAHIHTFTYIYNEELKKYLIASKDELEALNIKPKYVVLGKQPVCKGCENDNAEIAYKCSVEKINKIIMKKFRTFEVNAVSTQQRMIATFIIEKNGGVTVSDITTTPNNKSAVDEFRRVLKKLPDFNPGSYRDIPVRSSFNLPVTLNFN